MTTRELALHLINHADAAPAEIDLARSAEIISLLDPADGITDDLTPATLMDAWNGIVRSGDHEDNWSK